MHISWSSEQRLYSELLSDFSKHSFGVLNMELFWSCTRELLFEDAIFDASLIPRVMRWYVSKSSDCNYLYFVDN